MSDNAIKSTTQEFLDVYDIVNDMVLLKDGTASVVLQVGTMNFSLLAEQEQDAIIFTYGSLLNSLNYPIQISIQSQTKDATKYLRLLDDQIAKASSDRKANLIKKYKEFVAALIKERNVLQKRFFITIPATPGEMGLISASSVLPGKTTFDISTVEKSVLLEKAGNILEPRKDHLISQFSRLGLFAHQLTTQEIIQNFYINYNPEAADGQEISSSENYSTPLVRASFGGKNMQQTMQDMQNAQAPAVAPAQDPNPTLASNQAQVPNQAPVSAPTPEEIIGDGIVTEPTLPVEPEFPAEPVLSPEPAPVAQATPEPELNRENNLSLDPSLIGGNIPESAPESSVPTEAQQAPESQPAPELQQAPTLQQTPEPQLVQEPAPQPELPQVFAEEITPMQNNPDANSPDQNLPEMPKPAEI